MLCILLKALFLKGYVGGISVYKAGLGVLSVLCSPYYRYHKIDDTAGGDKALLDLLFILLLLKQSGVFPLYYLMLEAVPGVQYVPKAHDLRPSAGYGKHIYAKGILEPGLFIEHVGNAVNVAVLFQLHENAYAACVRSISYVGDLRKLFGLNQIRRILHELAYAGSDHGIRDLRDYKLILFPSF